MTNPFEPSQKGFHPEPFVGEAFWLPCSRTMPQPTQNYKEELRQVKKDSLDYRGRHRASAKRPATLFASNGWTHAPLGDRLRLAILDGSTRTRVSYHRQSGSRELRCRLFRDSSALSVRASSNLLRISHAAKRPDNLRRDWKSRPCKAL